MTSFLKCPCPRQGNSNELENTVYSQSDEIIAHICGDPESRASCTSTMQSHDNPRAEDVTVPIAARLGKLEPCS